MNPEGMNPSLDELQAVRNANNAPQRAAEAARLEALKQAEAAEVPVVLEHQLGGYGSGSMAGEQAPEADQSQAA